MRSEKTILRLEQLEKALISLEVMIKKPMDEDRGNIDATIQRFEFTIELFWKSLKAILEERGIAVHSPKSVLKEAFAERLIDDEQSWLDMLEDRNLTSHTYNQDLADEIYENIKEYVLVFRKAFNKISVE